MPSVIVHRGCWLRLNVLHPWGTRTAMVRLLIMLWWVVAYRNPSNSIWTPTRWCATEPDYYGKSGYAQTSVRHLPM
ncbi:hypothetical protein F5883DRAFT_540078 [Diaporthe sp. PMI_573]|nr:hypothetical protein F5883DRAFT_540078 [Diaporthaceae sp. PMI_573]